MGFHSRALLSGFLVLLLSGCGDSAGNSVENANLNQGDRVIPRQIAKPRPAPSIPQRMGRRLSALLYPLTLIAILKR